MAHERLGWAAWNAAPGLAFVVVTMRNPLHRVFGLFERIFLLTTTVWFALAAFKEHTVSSARAALTTVGVCEPRATW